MGPALLWLWRRPVATAPIRPLAWEPPYATGAAQEIKKTTKKDKKKKKERKKKRKLNIELPYDPAIPFLGIYLDETFRQKDICTPIFIVALFTIAKKQKQPKWPSTDEWMEEFPSRLSRNQSD